MQIDISIELIGLCIIVLTQIVLISISFKDLRSRVEYLEKECQELQTNTNTLIEVKTTVKLLYDHFIEKRKPLD